MSNDLVSTQSAKQRLLKKVALQQEDSCDSYSVMSACQLLSNLIEIDGFLSMALKTSYAVSKENCNGIDVLLKFISGFFTLLTSSTDEFINTSNGSFSIGNVIIVPIMLIS